MQIGWSLLVTPFSEDQGVGHDETGYAYDGFRQRKLNRQESKYGKRWQVGDVIGSLIDLENKQISFYRNDESMGVAFKNIKVAPNFAYFPTISLRQGQRVIFNFGADSPFRKRQSHDVCAIQEPMCHVKSYFSSAFYLIELLKRYVMSTNQEFKTLDFDQKLMVGSIIWEYLYPILIDDSYLMEDQLVQFIFDSQNIQIPGLVEIILDSMEIHFSNEQILRWTAAFMKIICRKASNINVNIVCTDTIQKREYELSFLKFTVAFLKRDNFLYSWLKSQHFDKDFENIFTMNLPTQEDINAVIQNVYHEQIPGTEKYKVEYENQIEKIILNIRAHQSYLIQITELLLSSKKLRLGNDATYQILVPKAVLASRLDQIALKNLGHLFSHQQYPGLSSQITLSNIFFCVSQFVDRIYENSVDLFPFQIFFKSDSNVTFNSSNLEILERLGGTFSYMERMMRNIIESLQKQPIPLQQDQDSIIMRSLIFLYICSFSQELSVYIKANEKIYVNSRTYEDFTEEGKLEKGEKLIDEMTSASSLLPQFQMILNIDFNRIALYKFGHWLARLINYIDLKYQGLIYVLPEEFMSIPFDIFRASKRGCIPLYEIENQGQKLKEEAQRALGQFNTSLSEELVSLISRHFYDEKIANPDFKETYLTRLNILLQSQFIMQTFEQCKDSQDLLIKGLLCSFDKKYLMLVSKNFLRFSKGKGFKEIALPAKVSENTYSALYLQKIREELLQSGNKISKNFMNVFFNTMNEMTTELFVIFKELKNNYNSQLLRRTRSTFQLIVDLYRILEVITRVAPEIFVDKMLIHSVRLINYLMFVLHSIFFGQIDSYIDYFSSKIMQKSENLPQLLAPFIGILTNLYEAVNTLGLNDNQRYDNLADIFQKTDSFDPVLFLKLKEVVKGQLPAVNLEEQKVFENFDIMLAEIDMLCQCNKIRKHSIKSQDSNGDHDGHDINSGQQDGSKINGVEEDFDEEKLCNICYYSIKDSMCIPCGHQTCFKCISLHTQNSQKCPFCNMEIMDIKKM